jgi:beta-lactamase regulating signal transducer with metallopeptidase domain
MLDWMIGTGLAVSLLILLVLIVRRPFARIFGARAAYALWVLPFLRLVMPEITIPRIFPSFSSPSSPAVTLPSDIILTPEMLVTLPAQPTLMSQAEPYLIPSLIGIWAFGAVIFFLYNWVGQAAFMDELTYNSEPASKLRREIDVAAQSIGLKHIPAVRISDDKAGPLVAGFIRPTVILPDNFMTIFSPEQRQYALMHEFMHIKRGDVWMALSWLAFRAINWPNPLVHYASKRFRTDQEAACDASVLGAVGDNRDTVSGYAETLIHAAKAAMATDTLKGRASPHPSPLALTIHHPLKERLMILKTHKKTSHWKSRIAASVMIIGAATLTAPLIQADAHPEEELAGKAETHTSKSVIKRMVQKDGEKISEHYEINVEGDDVKAFRIEPSGKKIRVDVKDIEGVDVSDMKAGHKGFTLSNSHGSKFDIETIEGVDGPEIKTRHKRIIISDNDGSKHMSREEFKKWAEKEYPEWKENDFASWVEGDFKGWASKKDTNRLVLRNEDGETRFVFKNGSNFPTPPTPPRFSGSSENVFVFESDDLKGLEGLKALEGLAGLEKLKALKGLKGLEALKGLEGLEKLEALKGLENFEGVKTFRLVTEGDGSTELKLRMTESKLAAARAMLEDTEVEAGDSREMAKAKRELEKARKALRAAERALKDAN